MLNLTLDLILAGLLHLEIEREGGREEKTHYDKDIGCVSCIWHK